MHDDVVAQMARPSGGDKRLDHELLVLVKNEPASAFKPHMACLCRWAEPSTHIHLLLP